MYRYAVVDSNGKVSIYSQEDSGPKLFSFHFEQGVGLIASGMSDGCMCIPWYWTDHTLRSSTITGINKPVEDMPQGYRLAQNYPNPFNPSTTISFTLPSHSFVSLKVFDLIGREVATLVLEEMPAGIHSLPWNASYLPSGVYFYRLQARPLYGKQVDAFMEIKKLILLK